MTTMIKDTTALNTEGQALYAPNGWVIPEEAMSSLNNHVQEEKHRRTVAHNLPVAALRAEQLIEELNDRLSIKVPVCYLRIDEGVSFHVLLLVERTDYTSPKIHAARLLAEKYMQQNKEFDIHFVFSVRSENMLVDPIKAQGYALMHLWEDQKEAA